MNADDAPAGLQQLLRPFARERVCGVENEVESPAEHGRVKVELDDRGDTEVPRILRGGSAAAASHRGTARQGDLSEN